MEKILEIRAAEGGDDAKLFVNELSSSYVKFFTKKGWLTSYITDVDNSGSNIIRIKVSGKNLDKLDNEAGGHRIQRVPPTEKRGRVHTSTVTVAIINSNDELYNNKINDNDIVVEWFNGTVGAGGQNHQKTQNCARIKHIPTGIIRTGQSRSRKNSYKIAMDALLKDIIDINKKISHDHINNDRRCQIGSGMRGDKIRTYQFQSDQVKDHISGKCANLSKVMKGNFDLLWK